MPLTPQERLAVLRLARRVTINSTLTGTTTLSTSDLYSRCDASGGAFTVTLPPARDMLGEDVVVKKIEAGANAVTVDGNGTETIDGALTTTLAGGARSKVTLRSFGTGWDIIA